MTDQPFVEIAMLLSEWIDTHTVSSTKKPTIVLAFDDYSEMDRAWRAMLSDFNTFMYPKDVIKLKEVTNFTVMGLDFQFRLKLNKEIT